MYIILNVGYHALISFCRQKRCDEEDACSVQVDGEYIHEEDPLWILSAS